MLLLILPKEGDITTLRVLRDLRKDLSFTEEEHKAYKFTLKDGSYVWDEPEGTTTTKEINLGPKAKNIIADSLKDLDKKKKLGMEYIDLYDQFIEKED